MLISPFLLKRFFGVSPNGVLHVGAHEAEEADAYLQQNFGRIIWVEAQKSLIPGIKKRVMGRGDLVLCGVAWSESGVLMDLKVTNNSQSTSVFDLAEHLDHYPEIVSVANVRVETSRLDELVPNGEKFDFLNLDIQGAELEAIKGLGTLIGNVRWIYTEINRRQLYEGIPLIGELDRYLGDLGFVRCAAVWTHAGWGDALYVREPQGASQWVSFFAQKGLFAVYAASNRAAVFLARVLWKSARHTLRGLRKFAR